MVTTIPIVYAAIFTTCVALTAMRTTWPECGNGECEKSDGETCHWCPADCGLCEGEEAKRKTTCRDEYCRLPVCKCCNGEIPGGIPANQAPQFIFLSVDDHLTEESWSAGIKKIVASRDLPRDAAGRTPRVTMFLCNYVHTEYPLIRTLHYLGSEIAGHSFTHATGVVTKGSQWKLELEANRGFSEMAAGLPNRTIRAFRAPFLSFGDELFTALIDQGILYDSSIVAPFSEVGTFLWPCTLDFGFPAKPTKSPIVSRAFPGIWELPVTDTHRPGALDVEYFAMDPPGTPTELLDRLKFTFDAHYSSNRAPLTLGIHGSYLIERPDRADTIVAFLRWAVSHRDVFFATGSEIIDYCSFPVPAGELAIRMWEIEKQAALERVARSGVEVCDGEDNDGDGDFDEGGVRRFCSHTTPDGSKFTYTTCLAECPTAVPSMANSSEAPISISIGAGESDGTFCSSIVIARPPGSPPPSGWTAHVVLTGGTLSSCSQCRADPHADSSWILSDVGGTLAARFCGKTTPLQAHSEIKVVSAKAWVFF